jgi:hypothetical protein
MAIDSRSFSQKAHKALTVLRGDLQDGKKDPIYALDKKHHDKASGLIQGLPAYIATWGLHRLSGDAKNFINGKAEDTKYKGKVYYKFLDSLAEFSGINFDPRNEGCFLEMDSLREYTALNHFAMRLAKEWSFWASSVLGEPEVK